MLRRLLKTTIALVLTASCAYAQNLDTLPRYEGDHSQYGEIRIWGNDTSLNLLRLWQVDFHKHQRGIKFVDYLPSTAAAIGALYTGVADLGLMGREAVPMEIQAFYRFFGYEPLEIVVAMGSYDVDSMTPGNVIYVNKQNPISRLTLKQLDGIFGDQRTGGWDGRTWTTKSARSAKENIRTWGQLGLTGEWADKPIHVYGYDLSVNGFSYSFQRKVFGGGDTWNPSYREFAFTEPGRDTRPKVGGPQIINAIANDPYGITYTAIQYGRQNTEVKPLALAAKDGGPYVEPTKENFINRTYPLAEKVCFYINRVPGKPVEPKLKEFLRYILSQQGQQAVAQDGGYLPLTAEEVRAQLKKIE